MVQLDIQLTEHFTLRELCDSETARRQKLPNIPVQDKTPISTVIADYKKSQENQGA